MYLCMRVYYFLVMQLGCLLFHQELPEEDKHVSLSSAVSAARHCLLQASSISLTNLCSRAS